MAFDPYRQGNSNYRQMMKRMETQDPIWLTNYRNEMLQELSRKSEMVDPDTARLLHSGSFEDVFPNVLLNLASKDGAFALVFTRKYLYAGLEHLGFEIMLTWPQVAGLVAAGITIAVVIYIVLVAMGYKPFPAITAKIIELNQLFRALHILWCNPGLQSLVAFLAENYGLNTSFMAPCWPSTPL